jgi:hypothetical protein
VIGSTSNQFLNADFDQNNGRNFHHKNVQQHFPSHNFPQNFPHNFPHNSPFSDGQVVFSEYYSTDIHHDIHLAALEDEKKHAINGNYMRNQRFISHNHRQNLINYLSGLRVKFQLKIDTFSLTVSIIDRFLAIREVDKSSLRLLGISALWIASKYEERKPLRIFELIKMSENQYDHPSLLYMERAITTTLDFKFSVPYAHHFAERYIFNLPNEVYGDKKTLILKLSTYLIESTYQHYYFVGILPSVLAASAVSLSLYSLRFEQHFPKSLEIASQVNFEYCREIFSALWERVHWVHTQHQLKSQYIQTTSKQFKVFDSILRLYSVPVWSHAPLYLPRFDPVNIPRVSKGIKEEETFEEQTC